MPGSGLNSAATSTEVDADAEASEPVEVSLDADFDKKEDKRESRKADKKAREEAESTGATVHSWDGETRRGLAGSPTKSPSSGLHKPTWRPSSKPNEHRKLNAFTDAMGKLAFWRHGTASNVEETSPTATVETTPTVAVDTEDVTVKATTASDVKFDLPDDSTGVPPEHKVSEPMYPTVVDVPLVEPTNANAPSAEKVENVNVKATPPVTAVAHTAPVTTVPVMTITASDVKMPKDEERTGLAPDHKDSEPMYPTVVSVPFEEANNPNGPSSAKNGNEDLLPVTVNKVDVVTTEDKVVKVKDTGDKVKVTDSKVKVTDVTSAPSINAVIAAANDLPAATDKKIKDTTTGSKSDSQTTTSTSTVRNSINAAIIAANASPIKSSGSSSSSNGKMMSSGKLSSIPSSPIPIP